MIKRRVFIIKGYSNNEQELKSDEYYVKSYMRFFLQRVGGSYLEDELTYLSEPSSEVLTETLTKDPIDFGIIVYIGHGATQDDNQLFQLNDAQIIKPGQFTLDCGKQIIILESCRNISEDIPTVDLTDKIPAFVKGGSVRHPLTKEQTREIYDSHIKRCENGLMICFACRIGFGAYNYLYSKAMIQNAMNWHLDSSRHCAILPIDELTRLAWVDTIAAANELGVQQMPESKESMNFPIAVSKF